MAHGAHAYANHTDTTAVGFRAFAEGAFNAAFGSNSSAQGVGASALGGMSEAIGLQATAVGMSAISNGRWSTAVGGGAYARSLKATAIGYDSQSIGDSVAVGALSWAEAAATALGTEARANALGIAVGTFSVAGERGISVGNETRTGVLGAAFGFRSTAESERGVAIGAFAHAAGDRGTALGVGAEARGDDSIALGEGALADRAGTVSVGAAQSWTDRGGVTHAATTRQIVNVAAGTQDTDAVNLGQMNTAIAAAFGGGTMAGAAFNSFAIGSGSSATRMNTVAVGSTGAERQITHVAAGTQDTDAVNLGQLREYFANSGGATAALYAASSAIATPRADALSPQAPQANTVDATQLDARARDAVATANRHADTVSQQQLQRANAYTDQQLRAFNAQIDEFQANVDRQLDQQDRRIDRQGAMNAAMAQMAINTAGLRTDNRVGMGIGGAGGEAAMSVGYQRALSDRATFSFGGAFSEGGEGSVGAGVGFGW